MSSIKKFYLLFFFLIVSLFAFALGAFFYILHCEKIDFSVLERYDAGKPSLVLDDEGKELFRFQLDRRKPTTLDTLPQHLIHAFIAAEDHTFFQHAGLSYKGIIRSIFVNFYHGRRVQGASTITQQLVRLLFLDTKKTFKRKIKEQFYALMVERQFSKEYILEAYLNNICLGCGIYGVEAACHRFWGKSVQDITIEQAATLAGIVKSPQHYCPLLFPLSAEKRRNVVLHSMHRLGFITQEDYQQALAVSVCIVKNEQESSGLHFKEMVRAFLESLVGKKLYTGGFIVQTTINQQVQHGAEQAFKDHLRHLRNLKVKDIDGALLSIDVQRGEIKAMIGGFDFFQSQFNRVFAKRQIGSTIKPIVYSAALLHGLNFAQTRIDEQVELVQNGVTWRPKNSTERFEGEMTLAHALSSSNNMLTIKVLLEVGIQKVAHLVQSFHLSDAVPLYPSLALGCIDCSLKDVVGMFNVFANHGVYVEPHAFKWVKNVWGKKIWKYKPVSERLLPARVSDQVARVLCLGIDRAKERYKDSWPAVESMGKTGTTNDFRTSWFMGSTPSLTTGIYIGCDDNKPLGKNMFGVKAAFPIWLQVNKNIVHPVKQFRYDPTLSEVTVHYRTGKKIDKHAPHAITILC